ncbi:MAG: DinB family protein [Planctomycetota bacterium]
MGGSADARRDILVAVIDEAFHHKAWHGPNLRGAVRRVDAKQAAWRPKPGRHSIAEIIVHCAYWKYAIRRRLRGDKRGSFPIKGSNWFALPQVLYEAEWRGYVKLLDAQHEALRETVATSSWTILGPGLGGSVARPAHRVYGIAMHDVYHAGQIQTLKALYKSAKV